MNNNEIKKFNQYCADVMEYNNDEVVNYDPYAFNNIFQLAAVVEKLISLTGKEPSYQTWLVWKNYVIDAMNDDSIRGDSLETKVRIELESYDVGILSKTEFIKRVISVTKSYDEVAPVIKDGEWQNVSFLEKIKNILIYTGYSFATSFYPGNNRAYDLLEESNIDPFYEGDDETLELWAWRQRAAVEKFFEGRKDLQDLWNSYQPYIYHTGEAINKWRQERIKWCVKRLSVIDAEEIV